MRWAMHARALLAFAITRSFPTAPLAPISSTATTLANSLVPKKVISARDSDGANQAELHKPHGTHFQHTKDGMQDWWGEGDPLLLQGLSNWPRHKHLAHWAGQHVQGWARVGRGHEGHGGAGRGVGAGHGARRGRHQFPSYQLLPLPCSHMP